MLEEREDFLLLVMIVLLLLLSAVIWVAFCIAVKRTAVKFLALKRQRRREVGSFVSLFVGTFRKMIGDNAFKFSPHEKICHSDFNTTMGFWL
ncbi:hypothetical protein Y032_0692g1580 [Ancylostoma ceylanicum]|uniref:Uncharacterized protein n=1 Tax=Ancylostoma ceylanicum TaxID=53326 RepID=A0A016WGR1_9BILA|nr:hypothetical protein Y032_0692g1580 [Ancylostoma ceylanicum]